jgi:hypothetical protein
VSDATAEFFERLGRQGHEPLLERTSGTLRFDIRRGRSTERWFVAVARGDVEVSHAAAGADCTVRAGGELFDGIASGGVNAMAALLRGALLVEGDQRLLVRFQRLFPDPPAEHGRAGGDAQR